MRSNAFYIRALLGVVAITALIIALFGRKEHGGSDTWLPSSFNSAARGHKALYTTLEELNWPVARWQGSFRDLTGSNQVLLMARNALSHRYPLQSLEVEQLLNWVAQGNTLILLGDFAESADAKPLLESLGFKNLTPATAGDRLYETGSELLERERKPITLEVSTSIDDSKGVLKIQMEQGLPLPPLPDKATSLIGSSSSAHAAALDHGKGRVILIASPSLIDNAFLQRSNNLPIALSLLQRNGQLPKKIWFEEAHHGYRTTFAITDLFEQPGVRLAAAQIAVGLLVFLSSQVIRFGPVRPLQPAAPRSTLEFVRSLANLYHRADIRNDIVLGLYRDTHAAVLRRLNLPPDASHELVTRQLKEAFPQLPSWKKLAQRFDGTDYVQGLPPSGWLKVSRDLILIKNTML